MDLDLEMTLILHCLIFKTFKSNQNDLLPDNLK